MTESGEVEALPTQAQALRAEVERLDRIADAIEEGLAEFNHELRRVGDAQVRAGRGSLSLDKEALRLEKNIDLGHKDLKGILAEQRDLKARLQTIENQLAAEE